MELNKLNYVEEAEKVIKSMRRKDRNGKCIKDKNGKYIFDLTTSKIRNLLSMISQIYNVASHETGEKINEDLQSQVQYFKMRFAYEAGRERAVEDFQEKAEIFSNVDKIGDSREKLICFCHYMEALVAYHRFYGGRD